MNDDILFRGIMNRMGQPPRPASGPTMDAWKARIPQDIEGKWPSTPRMPGNEELMEMAINAASPMGVAGVTRRAIAGPMLPPNRMSLDPTLSNALRFAKEGDFRMAGSQAKRAIGLAKARALAALLPESSIAPKSVRGDDVFVHGTTANNAPRVAASERLNPSAGERVYGDTDFHRDAAYVARPGSVWQDAERARASRAEPYDEFFRVGFEPGAKMARIDSPAQAEALARRLGYKNAREFMRNAGDSPDIDEVSPYTAEAYRRLTEELGADVLELGPRAADHMGTLEQVVALRPEKTRLLGRWSPPR